MTPEQYEELKALADQLGMDIEDALAYGDANGLDVDDLLDSLGALNHHRIQTARGWADQE